MCAVNKFREVRLTAASQEPQVDPCGSLPASHHQGAGLGAGSATPALTCAGPGPSAIPWYSS